MSRTAEVLKKISPIIMLADFKDRDFVLDIRDKEFDLTQIFQETPWHSDKVAEAATQVGRELGKRNLTCTLFTDDLLTDLRTNFAGTGDYEGKLSREYHRVWHKASSKNGEDEEPTAFNTAEIRRLAALSYLIGASEYSSK